MSSCGLTNLATCLPQKFFEFISGLVTAPVQPLLTLTQKLLTEPVNINLFLHLWAVIVYIISLFYGLFFLFAGFNLMISGYDSVKRERAKNWLQNIFFMILFVQMSFMIYGIIIEIGSLLTTGIISLIDPKFFLMKTDNIVNFGLQLALLIPQLLVILFTVLLLGLRYVMVSIGVVLFPIALFFYFIPPLKGYGKLILNILLVLIFITFFDAIVLFGVSTLFNAVIFANFKVLLVTIGFAMVNTIMLITLIFTIIKAAFGLLNSDVGRNVKSAAKYLI